MNMCLHNLNEIILLQIKYQKDNSFLYKRINSIQLHEYLE